MALVMASTRTRLDLYDGHPTNGLLIGSAQLGPNGRWTVRCDGTVKYCLRRRAASRMLERLGVALLNRPVRLRGGAR